MGTRRSKGTREENGIASHAQPVSVPRKKSGNHHNALTQNEKLVGRTLKKNVYLTDEEIAAINSKKGLISLLSTKNVNVRKALVKLKYEQELEKESPSLKVIQSGIWIDTVMSWLATSPDGLVYDKDELVGLLEIKCPFSAKDMTPIQAAESLPTFSCTNCP